MQCPACGPQTDLPFALSDDELFTALEYARMTALPRSRPCLHIALSLSLSLSLQPSCNPPLIVSLFPAPSTICAITFSSLVHFLPSLRWSTVVQRQGPTEAFRTSVLSPSPHVALYYATKARALPA